MIKLWSFHHSGGAKTCASVHVGEIRPGAIRGNHRHYTCNETFIIWGARLKFRVCFCFLMEFTSEIMLLVTVIVQIMRSRCLLGKEYMVGSVDFVICCCNSIAPIFVYQTTSTLLVLKIMCFFICNSIATILVQKYFSCTLFMDVPRKLSHLVKVQYCLYTYLDCIMARMRGWTTIIKVLLVKSWHILNQ